MTHGEISTTRRPEGERSRGELERDLEAVEALIRSPWIEVDLVAMGPGGSGRSREDPWVRLPQELRPMVLRMVKANLERRLLNAEGIGNGQ